MKLYKLFLTKNNCYKAGRTIKPAGIMVHSTAANNPYIKRYVGPDDGRLGKNLYGNHWNTSTPGGRQVCVHAFIGKLKDETIATYQTLPWNMRGWHAGGRANDTHIGFEICEDGHKADYFEKVYKEAVELCAYLCKQYGLTEKNIICHADGYDKGIASNHGDIYHWWPKFGKNMDTFRADVKKLLTPPVTAPGIPANSNADCITSTIKITWDKVPGATGYVVYRSTKSAGPYERVKVTSELSATDTTDGTAYYYKTRAYTKGPDGNVYGAPSAAFNA